MDHCRVWFQLRSIDNVHSSTLPQPTAAAGGNSHLHSLTYLALVLLLLVPVIGIPIHIDTSILSVGSVVGNENKSKTFSQNHFCGVNNLSFVVSSLSYLAFYTKKTSSASKKCVHWCQKWSTLSVFTTVATLRNPHIIRNIAFLLCHSVAIF